MSSTEAELSPLVVNGPQDAGRSVEVPPAHSEDGPAPEPEAGSPQPSPAGSARLARETSAAESLVLEYAQGQATEDPEDAEEEEILRGYKPYASRCMSSSQLRKHRAELLSVRDILVHGDAWMVCKLLAAENSYTCTALQHVLEASSGYKFLHKERRVEEKETPNEWRHRSRDGALIPRTGSISLSAHPGRRSRVVQLKQWESEKSPSPRTLRSGSSGDAAVEAPVQSDPSSPNRSSRAMTLVDESVHQRQQAESAEDFINRFVRPNIVTLSTVNKMLEEVELAAASRNKFEITLLLWSMTAVGMLVSWLLTEVWDVDQDLVQHIHHYWVGNNATGAG
jgi:hypothetical protein